MRRCSTQLQRSRILELSIRTTFTLRVPNVITNIYILTHYESTRSVHTLLEKLHTLHLLLLWSFVRERQSFIFFIAVYCIIDVHLKESYCIVLRLNEEVLTHIILPYKIQSVLCAMWRQARLSAKQNHRITSAYLANLFRIYSGGERVHLLFIFNSAKNYITDWNQLPNESQQPQFSFISLFFFRSLNIFFVANTTLVYDI